VAALVSWHCNQVAVMLPVLLLNCCQARWWVAGIAPATAVLCVGRCDRRKLIHELFLFSRSVLVDLGNVEFRLHYSSERSVDSGAAIRPARTLSSRIQADSAVTSSPETLAIVCTACRTTFEGWCQTLFLVLTCCVRNQEQSLTPQSLTPQSLTP